LEKVKEINQLIENDVNNLLGYLLHKDPDNKTELELFITLEANEIWQQKITKFNDSSQKQIMLPKLGTCTKEISEKLRTITNNNFTALRIMNDEIYINQTTKEFTIEYMQFKHKMFKLISKFSYKELMEVCFAETPLIEN
tara:strand:- start:150 stop:569 length:420 start_codon:yes stop_codon:yes gene_type:complete